MVIVLVEKAEHPGVANAKQANMSILHSAVTTGEPRGKSDDPDQRRRKAPTNTRREAIRDREELRVKASQMAREKAEVDKKIREQAENQKHQRERLRKASKDEENLRAENQQLRAEAARASAVRPDASHAAGLLILGVGMTATRNEKNAKNAYRRISRTVHPDVCNGPEASRLMKLVNDCWNSLPSGV